MTFRLRIWSRDFEEIGTIERETTGELLDMGAQLQKDFGAVCKLELVVEDCGLDLKQRT